MATQPPSTREKSRITEDGRPQWLALTFSGVYDEDVCQLVILLIRDTTEERLLGEQLAYDNTHDSLTVLTNRAAFDTFLQQALSDADDHPFAVMYIDLDKFKPINDTHGHRAGEHVLVTTAQRLRTAVGPHDVCARLSGDEFAVLPRNVHRTAPVAAVAERVTVTVAIPIDFDGDIRLGVTASIGIAIGSKQCAAADALKHDADLALYAVKERGRSGFLINYRFVEAPGAASAS